MRLVVGFAGVPQAIYDSFWRGRQNIVESDDVVIAESYKGGDAHYYGVKHASFFMKGFRKLLIEDDHNNLEDVGFVIVYVSTHAGALELSQTFFPSVLAVPVEWRLQGHSRTTLGRSANELLLALRAAVQTARSAIPSLKKELAEHDNRTPWLLPVRNFRSTVLIQQLDMLQIALCAGGSPREILDKARGAFEHAHPPQKIGKAVRRCFVDNHDVEFHPPGRARHAFARARFDDHPPSCLVAGRRRLGSPYDRAFHYDCSRGQSPLKGQFSSCHSDPENRAGNPHLNIAPNDFVRS